MLLDGMKDSSQKDFNLGLLRSPSSSLCSLSRMSTNVTAAVPCLGRDVVCSWLAQSLSGLAARAQDIRPGSTFFDCPALTKSKTTGCVQV